MVQLQDAHSALVVLARRLLLRGAQRMSDSAAQVQRGTTISTAAVLSLMSLHPHLQQDQLLLLAMLQFSRVHC